MTTSARSRIYRLAAVCVLLAALSFVLPRFFTNPEGGFAAGATAVLALLVMLFATSIFSLYLLAVTVRSYRDLSLGPRIAGIVPSLVLVFTLISLVLFLGF
ncbi:MAG: hypothetical protein HC807_04750 [Gammaproteobacteria bacterium]|nr:hypothetical protein [Gammaproteobacteria bacterium]